MTMMTDSIRILFASDLHFGSMEHNQEEMADAFASAIFPLLSETDIFFINGDFFDTIVDFNNRWFDPIYDTILKLFLLCENNRIILRLLQGTYTHDREQCKRFEAFYRNSGHSFDFKVVDGVTLEEIWVGQRELRILYVQDDLPFTSSDDVLEVIHERMRDMGWDHVDYGCMHGFFDFTCGNMPQDNVVVYKERQFPFVKKMIDVGHVHQHRIQGNVISNGSFDRLNHGDEDPKGFIRVFDYPDHYTAQFIENKKAAVYDTIRLTGDDTTESIRVKIDNHIAGLKTERRIHLRFETDSFEMLAAIKAYMKDVYPAIVVKSKKAASLDDKPTMIPASVFFTPVDRPIAPTPKTVATFIRARIPESYPLTVGEIDAYLTKSSK